MRFEGVGGNCSEVYEQTEQGSGDMEVWGDKWIGVLMDFWVILMRDNVVTRDFFDWTFCFRFRRV